MVFVRGPHTGNGLGVGPTLHIHRTNRGYNMASQRGLIQQALSVVLVVVVV